MSCVPLDGKFFTKGEGQMHNPYYLRPFPSMPEQAVPHIDSYRSLTPSAAILLATFVWALFTGLLFAGSPALCSILSVAFSHHRTPAVVPYVSPAALPSLASIGSSRQRSTSEASWRPFLLEASSVDEVDGISTPGTPQAARMASRVLAMEFAIQKIREAKGFREIVLAIQSLLWHWPSKPSTTDEEVEFSVFWGMLERFYECSGDPFHLSLLSSVVSRLGGRDPSFQGTLRAGCTALAQAALSSTIRGDEAVQLLHSLVRVGAQRPELGELLAVLREQSLVETLRFQSVMMLLWSLATTGVLPGDEAVLAGAVTRIKQLGIPNIRAQMVGQLAWSCARLRLADPYLLNFITQRAQEPVFLAATNPTTATLLIWSLLRLEALDLQVLGALRERSMQPAILQHFNRMDISLTFLTYARLGVRNLTFFDALANQTRSVVQRFGPQNIANTIWAMGRLGILHEPLLNDLVEQFVRREVLWRAKPQEITVTVWGLAKLNYFNHRTLHILANRISLGGLVYKGHELSIIAWAYGTFGIRDWRLIQHLARRASSAEVLRTLSAQNIANFVWACTALGFIIPDFLVALAPRLLNPEVLSSFTPHGIAGTLWGFSKLDRLYQPVFDQLLDLAMATEFRNFQLPALAMTCWALAEVYWHAEEQVVEAVVQRFLALLGGSEELIKPIDAHNLVVMAGAFGRWQVHDLRLMTAVSQSLMANESHLLSDLMAVDVSLLLWTLATLN
eukprot:EG_transcript_4637